MKNTHSLSILLMGFLLVLSGCGKQNHDVAVKRANVRVVDSNNAIHVVPKEDGTAHTPMQGLTGRVFATLDNSASQYQSIFMEMVQGFVSATDDPAAYGYVNGDPKSTSATGIYFDAHLAVSDRHIEVKDSYFVMEIRDQYTGQKAPNGMVIPAYPVRMPMLDYTYVEGRDYPLVMVFGDSFGKVTLYGYTHQDRVEGYLHFQNTTKYNGARPESGVLGSWTIPNCSLFNCN